jgi:hypothetical protein
MFEEQVSTNPGQFDDRTVTLKLQLVTCPQELLAVQVTVLVPSGKLLPLGGLQNSDGGGLQPPLAELL